MNVRTLSLAALLPALALAGCVSFGPKPPPELLRLAPVQTMPAGQLVISSSPMQTTWHRPVLIEHVYIAPAMPAQSSSPRPPWARSPWAISGSAA